MVGWLKAPIGPHPQRGVSAKCRLRLIGTPESILLRDINDMRLDTVINDCKNNETTGVEDEMAV